MPFESRLPSLALGAEELSRLNAIASSRKEEVRRVDRARMILAYAAGESISSIARSLRTNRPRVYRCIVKALDLGWELALDDLPGRGRRRSISSETEAWIIDLACRKPKDLGYAEELWSTRLLAKHIRSHCKKAGHPSVQRISPGTVSKILSRREVKPHRIKYYLERRDPEFARKKAEVLHVYAEVATMRAEGDSAKRKVAVISYDEKPGIQALATTAPDLPPVPGVHPELARDYEYVRHGTMTLMAGIDLTTGHVHPHVVDRHRSKEFVEFLKALDSAYPPDWTIRIILDNHSAHTSKETRAHLASVPNRFEFIFTPKHGSWLNLIETFFAKVAKSLLRGIRVSSKDELRRRILLYIQQVNREPVIHRWKHGIDLPGAH